MLNKSVEAFHAEVYKHAKSNIIKKLEKQGIDYQQLEQNDFDSLVDSEIEILKSDSKKVGLGVGLGIALTLLTGI